MQRYQFTTVDTILAKYYRDFRGLDINEGDAIEWIGEALGFMKMVSASEEAMSFFEVKNYQAALPNGLHYIIQLARDNRWSRSDECCPEAIIKEITSIPTGSCGCGPVNPGVLLNCDGEIIGEHEIAYYRPYFDLQYEYLGWANRRPYLTTQWSPIRLANHSFFNTLVCRTPEMEGIYQGSTDEYTIVQDHVRFNFKEGFVAMAYVRQMIDVNTGYPMVPDDESAKAAITYYLAWKIKQREAYLHREGAKGLADDAENKWYKYIKQFKNKTNMPQGTDQYQNLADQSRYLIPRHHRYYGFFGKLSNVEQRPFDDPMRRTRFSHYSGNREF